ncbi:unnamed protein product [Urochloa humidicola]
MSALNEASPAIFRRHAGRVRVAHPQANPSACEDVVGPRLDGAEPGAARRLQRGDDSAGAVGAELARLVLGDGAHGRRAALLLRRRRGPDPRRQGCAGDAVLAGAPVVVVVVAGGRLHRLCRDAPLPRRGAGLRLARVALLGWFGGDAALVALAAARTRSSATSELTRRRRDAAPAPPNPRPTRPAEEPDGTRRAHPDMPRT